MEKGATSHDATTRIKMYIRFVSSFFSVQLRWDYLSASQLAFSRMRRVPDRTINALQFGPIQSVSEGFLSYDGFDNADVRACVHCGRPAGLRRQFAAWFIERKRFPRFAAVARSTYAARGRIKTTFVNSLQRVMTCRFRARANENCFPLCWQDVYEDTPDSFLFVAQFDSVISSYCNFCNNRAGAPRLVRRSVCRNKWDCLLAIIERISVRDVTQP